MEINYKDFKNSKLMEKYFKVAIDDMIEKSIIINSDFAALRSCLFSFDELLTKTLEKETFLKNDFNKVLDEKIKNYKALIAAKEKILIEAQNVENVNFVLINNVTSDIYRLKLAIEYAEINKKYKTITIIENGKIVDNNYFDILKFTKDALQILNQSGLTLTIRSKLDNIFTLDKTGDTLAKTLERMISDDSTHKLKKN